MPGPRSRHSGGPGVKPSPHAAHQALEQLSRLPAQVFYLLI